MSNPRSTQPKAPKGPCKEKGTKRSVTNLRTLYIRARARVHNHIDPVAILN